MTAPRQAPWWERVVDGARQVVEFAVEHAEAPAVVEPVVEPRARPELAHGAGAPVDAELVDEAPCTITPRCTRRHGHKPPCAPEAP